jgi:hypothetical protein
MNKKLFSNNIFRIILIVFIGLDLINTTFSISSSNVSIPTVIFSYLNLTVTIFAFLSLFIISKYSLLLIKIYIILKLVIFPIYMILYGVKQYVIYSHNPFTIDKYFGFSFSLLIGIILYYFFKKYKLENFKG